MAVIEGTNTIDGALGILRSAGAPVAGTSALQTLTAAGPPTAGTFTLSFQGATTTPLNYNCAVSDVLAALTALSTIGTGGVTTAGGALPATPITVTFTGNLAAKNVPLLGVSSAGLTGGTVAAALTTPGVDATFRGSSKGQLLQDTTNATLYENTGIPGAPVWTAH
jgi:hypothetical protein